MRARHALRRPSIDPTAHDDADPFLVARLGPTNGRRCLMCGSPLHGRQRLYCPGDGRYSCAGMYYAEEREAAEQKGGGR